LKKSYPKPFSFPKLPNLIEVLMQLMLLIPGGAIEGKRMLKMWDGVLIIKLLTLL
jgi:hypothetical protein